MPPADEAEALAVLPPLRPPRPGGEAAGKEVEEWVNDVDEVSAQIQGIIDGSITDFEDFDRKVAIKQRAKQIREEDLIARRNNFYLHGTEGKGAGTRYKWWCKRCFVEFLIDLPANECTRCKKSDKMMCQEERRAELMGKLEDYKKTRASHQFRKDKWVRWKKSQALLGKSRNINYKAWEYWEPDTDTEDEGDPIVPKDNPEFQAMEADIKERHRKGAEKAKTAERCRLRGNQCMKDGDFVGAIEHYEEGLEYKRDNKALWTNKALAELKVFRWHDAISSCNKVIEYTEIFEDGFKRSADSCFKAFLRRATALRALHRWAEAAADLEDALTLFPKDREARDLLEKTQLARGEAEKAAALQEGPAAVQAPEPVPEPTDPTAPVRIEIEEEDSEDEAPKPAAPPAGNAAGSLGSLSKKDFAALIKRLGEKESERVLFCARRGATGAAPSAFRPDSKKVDLKKVEEVLEPSQLDDCLRDAERCCVLWRKMRGGGGAPLRADVQKVGGAKVSQSPEDAEAAEFVRTTASRIVAVLHVLASSSDHHCALTAPAIRHVWPLLAADEWRQGVLELLLEWSQRSITAKAMAEFASRYPDPHLKLLVEAIADERKENILPPGFEQRARAASERLSGGLDGMEDAFQEVLQGLSTKAPAELALSVLGNVALAGQGLPAFKEQMAAFRETLAPAVSKQLKPMNWRLCGPAAGAVCNLLRLGDAFAATLEEQCTAPLVETLRSEAEDSGGSPLLQALRVGGAGEVPRGIMPGMEGATTRLLAALINLLTVRPGSAAKLIELGLLDLAVPLMDPARAAALAPGTGNGEDGPAEVAARATLLVARLLGKAPAALSLEREAELLARLHASLQGGAAAVRAAAGADGPMPAVERLELAVRMVAILVTKTPGALDRLAQRAPRIQEVTGDAALAAGTPAEPAVPLGELVDRLTDIAIAAQPSEHVPLDQEGGPLSRLRGNLALLLASLCEAQSVEDAPAALRNLDLSSVVAPFVNALRKERGAVQNNIGVLITKLALSAKYKQKVRDLNGMESLHQIQLPRVEAQKAEAARRHRLETSDADRRHEIQRAKAVRELKEMD